MKGSLAILLALSLGACAERPLPPPVLAGANVERGRELITQLQCGACHRVPGVRTARGLVGPPLEGFAGRVYLAGKWPNQPRHLVRWLRDPPAMAPRTAMPALVADERDARDIAAYLYTLD